MKEIQALVSAIGKKRAILLTILVLINAGMAGVWQKVLLPQQDELTQSATKVQSERSKLQTDMRELPEKHKALLKNEERYDDLGKRNVFAPQDRIKARTNIDMLRQQAGLRGLDYKIEPQKIIDTPALGPAEKELVMSEMGLEMRGLTDHEIMKFMDKIQNSYSGIVVLKGFKIALKDDLTDANLERLKNGEAADFVTATANFEWYSITPKSDTGASPMSQAFQGSTP